MSKKLTPKQEKFVEEYLIDLNATQAAIRAGYSKKTANEQGCRLLVNVKVQDAIQKAMDERSARTEITADAVLQEIAKLGFSNMMDYTRTEDGKLAVDMSVMTRDQAAAISEFTVDTRIERDSDGSEVATIEKVKFKLSDKGINLERLGKHLKLFTEKREVTATVEVTTAEEVAAEVAATFKAADE